MIFLSLELAESSIGLVCESFPLKGLFVLFAKASFGIAACCWVEPGSFASWLLLSTEEAGFLPRLVVAEPANRQNFLPLHIDTNLLL